MRTKRNMDNHGVIVGQLQAQISEYASALSKEKSKRKKLRECLTAVAEKVCDSEYGNGQLGGKNQMLTLSDTELRDFVIKNTLKQKVESSRKILEIQNQYKATLEEKDNLARQLVDLRSRYNNLSVEYDKLKNQRAMDPYTVPNPQAEQAQPAPSSSVQGDGPDTGWNAGIESVPSSETVPEAMPVSNGVSTGTDLSMHSRPRPKTQKRPQNGQTSMQINESRNDRTDRSIDSHVSSIQPSVQASGGSSIVYVDNVPYDVNEMEKMIDIYGMKIIQLMGETGLNEQPELVDACMQTGELGSTTNIRENLKVLVQNHFLEETTISTPIRKKLTLYALSAIGVSLYEKQNGRKPVKDDMTKIKEMHATLPHGYCIKDTATLLEGMGYTEVCMDSSVNSVTIADGRRYVPDITAMSGPQKTYWEVELGHHHDKDMAEKLEKAAKVAKTVYIVVDKAETKKTLLRQIGYFKTELMRRRIDIDLILYLGTVNELQKKVYFNTNGNKIDLRKKQSRRN